MSGEAGFMLELRAFRDGALRMTREQFRECLLQSIGANADYADGCLNAFKDAPMHYVCSRTDGRQAIELVRACFEIAYTEAHIEATAADKAQPALFDLPASKGPADGWAR